MKRKRWVAAVLSLCLCLSPVGAAEGKTSFEDVPAGSWFEDGVALCAERGIMAGTGEGTFSPEAELTGAECLTIAVRVYDMVQRGGDGSLLTAPEDWGKIILTNVDGTVYTNRGPSPWEFGLPDGGNASRPKYDLYVVLSSTAPEDMERWELVDPPVGAATLTIGGETVSGTTAIAKAPTIGPFPRMEERLVFYADEPFSTEGYNAVSYPALTDWWRDAVYTTRQWDLNRVENQGFWLLLTNFHLSSSSTREHFAWALAEAAGPLPALHEDVTVPDVTSHPWNDDIRELYRAGILNGVDEAGSFAPDRLLTRAEAATMVARVLDPSLRRAK